MILKGSQRGNAAQLARHLMNARDNEHVELHEVRGFVGAELAEALGEAHAIAKGTRCRQFLFSLSLNPPEGVPVDIETFETAIEMVEQKLGLDDQPRAIVFHEKEGRRHGHAVWSRIDAESMTAKNLPFFKTRLMEVSREMYLEHGWEMPKGLIDRSLRNPLNFTRAEWQQAARVKSDPRLIKAMFREDWSASDNAATLKAALEEKGFFLARGDRRGVVAVDYRGEVYALARWSGVKARDVKARIADPETLPSVEARRAEIAKLMGDRLQTYQRDLDADAKRLRPAITYKRTQMVARQRREREKLKEAQDKRQTMEAQQRASRLPKGVRGLWSRITGRFSKIKQQNAVEAWQAHLRDRAEKDALIARQLDERARLQKTIKAMRQARAEEIQALRDEIARYLMMERGDIPKVAPEEHEPKAPAKSLGNRKDHQRDADGPQREI